MWIEPDKFIAFDFETSGTEPEYALQPWRVEQKKAWITSLAIAEREGSEIKTSGILNPTVDDLRALLERAGKEDKTLLGWNTAFDISWFIAYGLEDLVVQVSWLDGMLLWRHHAITPEYEIERGKKQSFSLKNCVRLLDPTNAGYEENVDFHTSDPEKLKELHEYNIKDTVFTLKYAEHWIKQLTDNQIRAAALEASSLPLIARANCKGIRVDQLAARELQAHLENVAHEALLELKEHDVTQEIIQSPKQLAELLFDRWGLTPIKETIGKKTNKVSRSTDKEVLQTLAEYDTRVQTIKTYREALNNKTKFADTPLVSVEYNENGCTHPQARIFGTYSGRVTYDSKQGKNKGTKQIGFAIHQEKRSPLYRDIIIPPEGYMLMEFDAAGQEFRWMAIASDDRTMLQLCEDGQDPHSYMGAQISGIGYLDLMEGVKNGDKKAKHFRQLGKIANLSLQYRTSANKLQKVAKVQYGVDMDIQMAKQIHYLYRTIYNNVPRYWEMQITYAQYNKYVATFAGRRVNIDGNWGTDAWAMGSTAINYRIQGTGADQKYFALAIIKPYLVQHGIYFAWDLHDGIYLYVPKDKVQKAAEDLKDILDNLPYAVAWEFTPPIPLPWDCKVGASWGQLKEYKP